MKVKIYEDSDYEMVKGWYEARNHPVPDKGILPSVGLVVEGVAAGFIYNVEGKFGLLEEIISNPKSTAKERNQALDFIFLTLLDYAKEEGLKLVIGFSKNKAAMERAKNFGFAEDDSNYNMLAVRLD